MEKDCIQKGGSYFGKGKELAVVTMPLHDRNGDTVGTLACADFECSANVRKRPPVAYIGFDVEAARHQRIEALRRNVSGFVREVRDGG